jgi:transposase-like protein
MRNGITNKEHYAIEFTAIQNDWFRIIHNKRFHDIIPILIASYVNCTDDHGNSAFFYYITNTNTKKYNFELIKTFVDHDAKIIINGKEFAKIKTKSIDLAIKYPTRFVFYDVFGNDLAMAIVNSDMIYQRKIDSIFTLINNRHINWNYRNYNNESLAEVINNSLNINIPVKKKLIRKIAMYYSITVPRVVENFREIIIEAELHIFCLMLNCPLCRTKNVTVSEITDKSFTCIICMDEYNYNVKLSCNHDEICRTCIFALSGALNFYSQRLDYWFDNQQGRAAEHRTRYNYVINTVGDIEQIVHRAQRTMAHIPLRSIRPTQPSVYEHTTIYTDINL